MALTAAGVGSGIDVESILSQLAEIEQVPVEVLNDKRAELDVDLSSYGRVRSALSEFQTAADALGAGATSDFGGFVATTSDEEVFTATASNGTTAVNHEVEVLALATNHRLSSAPYESSDSSVEQGTLTFSSGENSFDVDIDGTNDTLAGLRDAINGHEDNTSVSASIIHVDGGSRLVITSRETGTEGRIDISNGGLGILGDNDTGFTEINPPTDASLVVHGFNATRSSNEISDLISGVTLNLTGTGTAVVDSRRDLTSLREAVDGFVSAYNTMASTVESLSQTDLIGDQLPRGVDRSMRDAFFTAVEYTENDSANMLDMGFSFDEFGTLSLNESGYEAALDQGVNRYVDLFTQRDTGLSSLFSDAIDEYIKSDGIIEGREDGVSTRQSDIDDQIERLEYRIGITNDRLRAQFTAMDLVISELNSSSGFLSGLLGQDTN